MRANCPDLCYSRWNRPLGMPPRSGHAYLRLQLSTFLLWRKHAGRSHVVRSSVSSGQHVPSVRRRADPREQDACRGRRGCDAGRDGEPVLEQARQVRASTTTRNRGIRASAQKTLIPNCKWDSSKNDESAPRGRAFPRSLTIGLSEYGHKLGDMHRLLGQEHAGTTVVWNHPLRGGDKGFRGAAHSPWAEKQG